MSGSLCLLCKVFAKHPGLNYHDFFTRFFFSKNGFPWGKKVFTLAHNSNNHTCSFCWRQEADALKEDFQSFFGGDNGRLQERSHQGLLPRLLLPVSLCLQWATATPSLCKRPSNTSTLVVDRVLVLQPGVRPQPLRWKSWIQDIGPPETSWPHVISNGESSPRYLHLTARIQLHSKTSKLQLAREEHNPTH